MKQTESQLVRATETISSPAHCLRELIENSIDAKSTILNISIDHCGLESIIISDNGCGIGREGLEILCKEGVTSKEYGGETSGGRGKALDAIASLSNIVIESCANDSGNGYRLTFDENRERVIKSISRPRGTTIIVQSLFYNYPVRRRYWIEHKKNQIQQIQEMTILFAVAYRARFSLTIDSKSSLQISNRSRLQKIKEVVGYTISNGLLNGDVSLEDWNKDAHIEYYTSSPTTLSNGKINIFINDRPCTCLSISKSLKQEFKLCAGPKTPSIFLFIYAERKLYDYFPDSPLIGATFSNQGLLQRILCNIFGSIWKSSAETLTFKKNTTPIELSQSSSKIKSKTNNISGAEICIKLNTDRIMSQYQKTLEYKPKEIHTPIEIQTSTFQEMEVIGQWNKSFIITKYGNDIYAIDQHAANEAANFEKLRKQKSKKKQILIEPKILKLTPDVLESAISHKEQCFQLGFEYNILENGIELTAIPSDKTVVNGIDDLQELLGLIEDVPYSTPMTFNARSQLAYHACHSSVRVGDTLSKQQMESLLKRMSNSDYPWNCPHGRPTWCCIHTLCSKE